MGSMGGMGPMGGGHDDFGSGFSSMFGPGGGMGGFGGGGPMGGILINMLHQLSAMLHVIPGTHCSTVASFQFMLQAHVCPA